MQLQTLLDTIGGAYVIQEKDYPAVANLTDEQKYIFALSHSLIHVMKSAGRIATEIEKAEHGDIYDKVLIEKATVNALISVLKLAEIQGMKGDELYQKTLDNI